MKLTIKQYAAEWGVTVRTVERWVAKGAVETVRTPGGGVRIVGARRASNVLILTKADIDPQSASSS